jgi:hypothetical protein
MFSLNNINQLGFVMEAACVYRSADWMIKYLYDLQNALKGHARCWV